MKVTCDQCLICLEKRPHDIKNTSNNFCSTYCHNLWMSVNQVGESSPSYRDGLKGKKEFSCDWCGSTFLRKVSALKGSHKFCSKRCYGDWSIKFKVGAASSQWKGGITSKQRSARTKVSYIKWRTSVFKLDNYICVFCGYSGKGLNAHHDYSFSEFPKLRECINNGITLCTQCHKQLHRRKQ